VVAVGNALRNDSVAFVAVVAVVAVIVALVIVVSGSARRQRAGFALEVLSPLVSASHSVWAP
jgi:hypothetical protein